MAQGLPVPQSFSFQVTTEEDSEPAPRINPVESQYKGKKEDLYGVVDHSKDITGIVCPITKSVMVDPVMDPEGNSFEREAITRWINLCGTSPITRKPLREADLIPNRALCDAIKQLNISSKAANEGPRVGIERGSGGGVGGAGSGMPRSRLASIDTEEWSPPAVSQELGAPLIDVQGFYDMIAEDRLSREKLGAQAQFRHRLEQQAENAAASANGGKNGKKGGEKGKKGGKKKQMSYTDFESDFISATNTSDRGSSSASASASAGASAAAPSRPKKKASLSRVAVHKYVALWLRLSVSRNVAEQCLRAAIRSSSAPNGGKGLYLLRRSLKQQNEIVLTLMADGSKIYHFRIQYSKGSASGRTYDFFVWDAKPNAKPIKHPSLSKLLEYFKTHELGKFGSLPAQTKKCIPPPVGSLN